MKKLITIIFLLIPFVSNSQMVINPFWYSVDDGFYRVITVDPTKVDADLVDFPVLFSGTYTYLKTQANGGKVIDGNDIRIYEDAGLTTLADFEIEFWNATTGDIQLWFKGDLNDASNTLFYLTYGNPAFNTDVSDAPGTFASYRAVWHLKDGTTLSAEDATGINDGTLHNSPAATTGQIDGAGSFSLASSTYISLPADASLDISGSITLEAWVNISSTAIDQVIIGGYNNSAPYDGYGFGVGVGLPHKISYWSATTGLWVNGNTDVDDNVWHHIAVTVNGTSTTFYVDGQPDGTPASNNPSSYSGTRILASSNFFGSNFTTGILDEIRIMAGNVSDEWISTQYNNQSDPSTFYTVGAEN